jgi:hypothetical protein
MKTDAQWTRSARTNGRFRGLRHAKTPRVTTRMGFQIGHKENPYAP